MSNRQQRRAALKKGKRRGETYADVLAQKKMIKEAVEKSAHDNTVALEVDIKLQRFLWMAVIALNEEFGFGGERAKRFMLALETVANEAEQMARENGGAYAQAKLMQRAGQITGIPIEPVHEAQMREARERNQAEGICFPPDDPDIW